MRFGYHHCSFKDSDDDRPLFEAARDRVALLEAGGFSIVTTMDHFWQLGGNGYHDEPFLDCYSALNAFAAVTDEIELSALVTCPHYRNPGYLARVLASLDAISGGRAVLGIGAGWYTSEYEAIGLEYPDISTRNRQMREVIELCRAAWNTESPVTFDGQFFELESFYLEPKPENVPVMVGGRENSWRCVRSPNTPTAGMSGRSRPPSSRRSSRYSNDIASVSIGTRAISGSPT